MPLGKVLTHYHRSFSKPLRSISALPADEQSAVLDALARHEPLPYRLTHHDYVSERHRIEAIMREQFTAKGGRIERDQPHYFVLGRFSLWEENGWSKVEVPLDSIPEHSVSFTMTDSFFNYRSTNLRGVAIPPRPYHGALFTRAELPAQLELHGSPGDAWRTDPTRIFDTYVEAQVWSDAPLRHLLDA